MTEKKWYMEEHEISLAWSWVIIILFSAAIAGFGWLVHCSIPDTERRWDVGQLPDTPAESVYSTEQPKYAPHPRRQLPALPESRPAPSDAAGNKARGER